MLVKGHVTVEGKELGVASVEEAAGRAAGEGKLSGKVALVTGAAQGLGQAFAERLAADGAAVVVVGHRNPPDETAARVEAAGAELLVHRADVSSAEQVAGLVEAVERRFGRVDVLVNNAGVYPMQPFLEMEYSQWREMFATNADSVFHLCRAFVPGMVERGQGKVINVTSTSVAAGMANYTHYNASKAALIGFTRSLAKEVGPHGVNVNALAPGLVRTPTTDSGPQADGMFDGFLAEQCIKRTEVPEDLAGTVSWLASSDSDFVTGQTIAVDGGWVFN
jgi:NAD(P)-dependent dehydrogenase (short-subunit alcohol dehydrogenase family)